MSVKENNVKKKYRLVPPDGGWGYIIIIAVTINLSVTTMFLSSFGLMYKEFLENTGMNTSHVTMLMGIYSMCSAITGFITNSLLSIMKMRTLLFVGTIIYNAGMIGSVFVTTIFPFYICVGVLPGVGLGIVFNLSFTILNQYFVHKRLMAISISQMVIALLTMLVPMFLKWSLEEYGYRGTLLLVVGITLNSFLAVALTHPVEWHMKKVEILDNEMNVLLIEKEFNVKHKVPVLKLIDVEGNLTKTNEKSYEVSPDSEGLSRLKKILDLLFHKSLRQSYLLSCVSIGPSLCVFADMNYNLMLPQALYAADWTKYNVALALSLMGFGDLTMRIVFICCSSWLLKLGSEMAYVLGILIALVSRLGMLWSKSLVANMIFIALTGVAHCPISTLIPVVIADAVPPQKFTSAMGISMMLTGIVNLVLGPAIGAVRDLSQSYGAAFYLIASCLAMVALFWLIELCYKKNKHKRLQRKEYLRQKKINKG